MCVCPAYLDVCAYAYISAPYSRTCPAVFDAISLTIRAQYFEALLNRLVPVFTCGSKCLRHFVTSNVVVIDFISTCMSESSALCATCYQEADVELASLRKQYSSILDKAAEKDDEVWQAYIQK